MIPDSVCRRAYVLALLPALASSSLACQDHEQRARAIGTTARDAVSSRCTSDAGATTDDEACADQACREECAKRVVPRGFTQTCLDTCRQTAICATDADCGPGKQCIAIAPVVRRCVTKP